MAEWKDFMSLLKCPRVVFSFGLLAVVQWAAGLATHAAGSRLAVLVVSNPTSLPRPEEVLEVPLSAVTGEIGSGIDVEPLSRSLPRASPSSAQDTLGVNRIE